MNAHSQIRDLYMLLDKIDEIAEQVERLVCNLDEVNTKDLNLDYRCGNVFVSIEEDNRCIIVTKDGQKGLEYYGGFEYIDRDNVMNLGNYIIYLEINGCGEECDRVKEALEHYEEVTLTQ